MGADNFTIDITLAPEVVEFEGFINYGSPIQTGATTCRGVVEAYVERDLSPSDIAALGYPEETVRWVVAAVDRSEYKRRQAPPGIKITTRAFGKDRRMPITNRYRR